MKALLWTAAHSPLGSIVTMKLSKDLATLTPAMTAGELCRASAYDRTLP